MIIDLVSDTHMPRFGPAFGYGLVRVEHGVVTPELVTYPTRNG